MKKIWLMSAVTSICLLAEGTQSLEEQLENIKINDDKTSSFPLNISLIVDSSYNDISFDNEDEKAHVEIPGFVHGGGHDHDDHAHTSLQGDDGFNFNYAELSISASVDKYFDLMSVFHITEDDFETEEAYATTRSLPYNLQAKIGKFKSDFGYLNNKHQHNYNFYEMPLIYQAILGDHGITENGVQLQYVFPAPHYIMIGIEALEGDNEQSFGTEGFLGVDDVDQPNLWLGYVKTSLDISGGTLLAGASMAKGDSRINHVDDEEEAHAFAGDTTIYGVDLTYKYYMAADHAITWQSEYIYRKMDGTKYIPNDTGDGWVNEISLEKKQAGFYSELVYQYDKNWRGGLRYSGITKNDITADGVGTDIPDDMYVTSAMLEYNPSEFSRLRLQYNHNSALYTDEGEKNNKDEIILEFNYAIGAHAAHTF